jgi:hypothetical protein
MVDPGFDWAGAMMQFKNGVDMLRTTVGLVRDVRDVLPAGVQRDAITSAIDQSASQLQLAEAQIAVGLGYELCRCAFPPTIMLTVGHLSGRGVPPRTGPVYECPKCGHDTAAPFTFTRTGSI